MELLEKLQLPQTGPEADGGNDSRPGNSVKIEYLTITNWRLLCSLHKKPPRILGGHSKKNKEIYKFSQKLETSGHQSNNSNYNSHQVCYLF